MPPTLVNMAVGVLLGVALLGRAFDRESLLLVAVVAGLPDLDAVVSLFIVGATNAVLHSVFIPGFAATALYWDTNLRVESWVSRHAGRYGVRVAWVAIATYTIAGIGIDLFNVESVAVLYPVSTKYFAIVGQLVVSSQEGLIQTYVQLGTGGLDVASPGSIGTYHVESWINPTAGTGNPAGVGRRLRVVESGWQLVVVVTALIAAPAKWIMDERTD